jgi:Rrf2 family protein
LVYLAALAPGDPSQALGIAETNSIPKKFLDAIFGDLRNASIVHRKKGPGGGYAVARMASEIKVGHVIRTPDGPAALPIGTAAMSKRA